MTDFKARLIAERDDLQERFRKLSDFFVSDTFRDLSDIHRVLLTQQHSQMGALLLTLNQRLDRL